MSNPKYFEWRKKTNIYFNDKNIFSRHTNCPNYNIGPAKNFPYAPQIINASYFK